MTSIGSSSTSYTSSYASIIAQAQARAQTAATGTSSASGSSSATTITLSDAARAALASKDLTTVLAEVRDKLDALLAKAQLTSPLAADKLAVDLSDLDRRELFAVAGNLGQGFTADEQTAAKLELQNRFDHALAGPTSVGRVTGKLDGLYAAALAWYEGAGPEEKASAGFVDAKKTIEQMIAALRSDPSTLPGTYAADPVNDYMQRLAAGETGELRAIADVGADARATLDAQYAAGGTTPDFAEFDSRSLAAVAINTGDAFSDAEMRAAKSEMRSRTGAAVLAALKSSDAATNPAGFAENVISLFGAMSSEERAAAGWSDNLYAAAVASYQSASKLTSLLGATTGISMWGDDSSSESSGSGDKMSIMSYM
jgi:hypothetical protein